MRETGAAFSLGTAFADWPRQGAHSFRPFGDIGARLDGLAFHHHWLRLRSAGERAALGDYALGAAAAQRGKVRAAGAGQAVRSCRRSTTPIIWTEPRRIRRCCARARSGKAWSASRARSRMCKLRGADGFIEAVTLRDGQQLAAELFIDCTGAQGALIEGALKTGFEDWRRWLPCDRAIAGVAEQHAGSGAVPHARRAGAAGWSWAIPLRGKRRPRPCLCQCVHARRRGRAHAARRPGDTPMAAPRMLARLHPAGGASPGR